MIKIIKLIYTYTLLGLIILSGFYLIGLPVLDLNNYEKNPTQYQPSSIFDPLSSRSIQDVLSGDISKTDPLLSRWIDTGEMPEHIAKIGNKSSILLLVKNDPTLDNTISPLGSFKFGDLNLYWVHTSVSNSKEITKIASNKDVIRIVTDNSNVKENNDPFKPNLDVEHITESVKTAALPGTDPVIEVQNLSTRNLLGANYVEDTFGYNGTGSVVNVHDTGVDFGNTALVGTLLLDSQGRSTAFDGTGGGVALTNKWSEQYYRNLGDDITADYFLPLYSDSNNKLNTTGYEKLMVWSANNYKVQELGGDLRLPLPDIYDVTGIPGNATGFQFGIVAMNNGIFWNFVPFLSVDSDGNGSYDSLYFDWETGYFMSGVELGIISVEDYITRASFSFAKFGPYSDLDNPYLAADFFGPDDIGTDDFSNPDGYNDMSLGVLGNVFDVKNITGRIGVSDPLLRGIDPEGIGFGFFFDYAGHGTGVAGSIAAQDVEFQIQQNTTLYSIRGVAPGTKIIGTTGLVSSSADIYSMLWISGYEPNVNLEWTFVGEHIADVSSNSWGFPEFADLIGLNDNLVGGYDFYSMFFELLTPQGFISEDHPGMIFVVSAGNSGPGYGTGGSPFGPGLILVGASTNSWFRENIDINDPWASGQPSDQIIGFSSAGPGPYNYPTVDVVNVGAFDYSTLPVLPYIFTQGDRRFAGGNGTFQLFSGTSEAAPYTSAVVAILLEAYKDQYNETLKPDDAKLYLKSSAKDLGFDTYKQGAGRASIDRGVHLILNGSMPNGEELFLINGTDAYTTAGDRINTAFEFWFGGTNPLGDTETLPNSSSMLSHPSKTVTQSDTVFYGGVVSQGTSYTADFIVNGNVNRFDAYRFETFYNATSNLFISAEEYNINFLRDMFDMSLLQQADFVQISLVMDQNQFEKIAREGAVVELSLARHVDLDSDNVVDDRERLLDTFTFADNNILNVFGNSVTVQNNSMVLMVDTSFNEEFEGSPILDTEYRIGIRAFKRVIDNSITIVDEGSNNNYSITVNVDANAVPGFYQGFVKFQGVNKGYALIPYTYSVPIQVDDYENGGWSEVSGLSNRPFDNGVFGAVDLSWRASTGDWRFFDLKFAGTVSTANTLALEVEWTYADTVLDVIVYDNDGLDIARSEINYLGQGKYNSTPNAPPTMQRLLINVTSYRMGDTLSGDDLTGRNSIFTVALHATTVSSQAILLDPFSVRAAWLTDTVGSLGEPTPTLITSDGEFLSDGTPLTFNKIGVDWSEINIPNIGFTNIQFPHEYKVSRPMFFNVEETIPSEDLSSGGDEKNIEREFEIELREGMEVSVELSWPEFSTDFDLLLVKKGSALTSGASIIKSTQSGANPEIGTGIVPSNGIYILAVDYSEGDGSAQSFKLDLIARNVISRLIDNTGSIYQINLIDTGEIEADYLIESTASGWNQRFKYSELVRFDGYAPTLNVSGSIPELATSGPVRIGSVYDASTYNFTLSLNGMVLVEYENVNGTNDIIIEASLIEGFFNPTNFTAAGLDQFGRVLSSSLSIFRTDNTLPKFLIQPADREVLIDQSFNLIWTIQDISSGTFELKVNGQFNQNGNWSPSEDLNLTLVFDSLGTKFLRLNVTDAGGNSFGSTVIIRVVEKLSEPTDSDIITNNTDDTDPNKEINEAANRFIIPAIIAVVIISGLAAGGTVYRRRRMITNK